MTAGTLALLVVDHDPGRSSTLERSFGRSGHRVVACATGHDALLAADRDHFDALIVERDLPRFDGIALVETLRHRECTTPVALLSDMGEPMNRIRGLEAGADDYIVRPAAPREILARVAAVLRGRQWAVASNDSLCVGEIRISPSRHRAWHRGRMLDLSRTEFELLSELARNADAVLTRPMLAERVWGQEEAPSNVIDVFIRRLRRKLADDSPAPIVTIRGVGYMMRRPEPRAAARR
jgi:two-component system, OmpR family, response regulator